MSESMWEHFEVYPEDPRHGLDKIDKQMWHPLYSVEFTRWKKGEPMRWRLFKKSFIYSREEWNKMVMEDPEKLHQTTLMGNEGHPYQLANGDVNELPNVICMETMAFLKYMVDALNAKALNDDFVVGMIKDAFHRAKEKNDEEHGLGCELGPFELPDELKPFLKKEEPIDEEILKELLDAAEHKEITEDSP